MPATSFRVSGWAAIASFIAVVALVAVSLLASPDHHERPDCNMIHTGVCALMGRLDSE